MHVVVLSLVQLFVTRGLWPIRPLCAWNFPGKNNGVGCHFLLQRLFPTQGWKLHLLYWQADSLSVQHMGSPYIHINVFVIQSVSHVQLFAPPNRLQHASLPCPSLSPRVCSTSWIDRFYLLVVIYIIHTYNQHAHIHIPFFFLFFFSILFMY